MADARIQLRRLFCKLGDKAQSTIYEKSSVDLALKDAFRKMRAFLMNTIGLTEDEAISLMSIAVDFGITQVVDGNWGFTQSSRKAFSRTRWRESKLTSNITCSNYASDSVMVRIQ